MSLKYFPQSAIRLPFQFDGPKMKSELKALSNSYELIKNLFTGNTLVGIELITPNSDNALNEKGESFTMSKELQQSPYLQEVLSTFKSDKLTFRMQNLKPGGKITKHRDILTGLDHGVVRLNIPVETNENVFVYYNDEHIPMKSGECWLPNVTNPHYMENKSSETRWQLLVDCLLNDWWRDLITSYGADFNSTNQYASYSLEQLNDMKTRFLESGFSEEHEIVVEILQEIATRK